MQGLKFIQNYEGKRVEREFGAKQFWVEDEAEETDDVPNESAINLGLEIEAGAWQAVNPQLPKSWRVQDWLSRPVRFVDGKDVGQTVAWLRGTDGSFVAIRLAEIGSVVMKIVNGELRREFAQVERVLAMNTAVFPWEEVESFAIALREHDIALLPTKRTPEEFQMNFEKIRKFTQRRSMREMMTLEEFALAQRDDLPTIVDGTLKDHEGGFDADESPVFGIVKTQQRLYIDRQGQEILFGLPEAHRTPAFSFSYDTSRVNDKVKIRLPIVAWYMRLCDGESVEPNVGIVRVEVSHKWFANKGYGETEINAAGKDFINQLTRTIYEYRCRQKSYRRMKISLEPIVRAEESLGALFCPPNYLKNQFYRLTEL
ncbi:MAG: hypothetical protein LH472_02710 [Pyrinomonadaceae bacterium]|nr:hypothetical protein [Pyrinomonadaceae bacterium]